MIILNWLYEIRAEVLNNLLFAILANYWLENFMYIHIVYRFRLLRIAFLMKLYSGLLDVVHFMD
jgi:hypothetical protein